MFVFPRLLWSQVEHEGIICSAHSEFRLGADSNTAECLEGDWRVKFSSSYLLYMNVWQVGVSKLKCFLRQWLQTTVGVGKKIGSTQTKSSTLQASQTDYVFDQRDKKTKQKNSCEISFINDDSSRAEKLHNTKKRSNSLPLRSWKLWMFAWNNLSTI